MLGGFRGEAAFLREFNSIKNYENTQFIDAMYGNNLLMGASDTC